MTYQYEFNAQNVIEEGRTTREAINQIKDWLRTTKFPQIPEELIVLFLLSCDNNIENAQKTIKAYFRIKKDAPEIFSNRNIDSPQLQKASEVINVISIPVRMEGNTVIHLFTLKDSNYRHFDLVEIVKMAFMLIDVSQRSNPPNDLVVLIDMKGSGFMHLTRFKVGVVKSLLEFLQEAMPLKIKAIHILNANYIFDRIIALARLFINTELMSIIKTHPPDTDMKDFFQTCIPAVCMPKDHGGELPTCEELHEQCVQKFRELKEYFEAEEILSKNSCYS